MSGTKESRLSIFAATCSALVADLDFQDYTGEKKRWASLLKKEADLYALIALRTDAVTQMYLERRADAIYKEYKTPEEKAAILVMIADKYTAERKYYKPVARFAKKFLKFAGKKINEYDLSKIKKHLV